MPPRNRRDVAIFNRHRLTRRLELVLLLRPYVSGRYVKPKNSTVHGLDQIRQPLLQRDALLSALSAHPECQLCNYDRTRVALVLMFFQPRDDACIAGLLSRLTQHIGIKKPAHSLRRLGNSRLRGGRSSILTGQPLRTVSQFVLLDRRRNMTASSSGSNIASKLSPGCADTRLAGSVSPACRIDDFG
jgi:hypothetical protein